MAAINSMPNNGGQSIQAVKQDTAFEKEEHIHKNHPTVLFAFPLKLAWWCIENFCRSCLTRWQVTNRFACPVWRWIACRLHIYSYSLTARTFHFASCYSTEQGLHEPRAKSISARISRHTTCVCVVWCQIRRTKTNSKYMRNITERMVSFLAEYRNYSICEAWLFASLNKWLMHPRCGTEKPSGRVEPSAMQQRLASG